MADFLSRLAERALGRVSVAQPVVAPLFASGPNLRTDTPPSVPELLGELRAPPEETLGARASRPPLVASSGPATAEQVTTSPQEFADALVGPVAQPQLQLSTDHGPLTNSLPVPPGADSRPVPQRTTRDGRRTSPLQDVALVPPAATARGGAAGEQEVASRLNPPDAVLKADGGAGEAVEDESLPGVVEQVLGARASRPPLVLPGAERQREGDDTGSGKAQGGGGTPALPGFPDALLALTTTRGSPRPVITRGRVPEVTLEEAPTTARVTIGRVEVRAALQPQAGPPPRRQAAPGNGPLSLKEYLKQRNEGRR